LSFYVLFFILLEEDATLKKRGISDN